MTPNLETNLKEVLNRIETKLDTVIQDVSEIKTDIAVLKVNQDNIKEQFSKTDLGVLKTNQDNIKEQLADINGTQKAQIWTLITAVLGAIVTLAVALFRKRIV